MWIYFKSADNIFDKTRLGAIQNNWMVNFRNVLLSKKSKIVPCSNRVTWQKFVWLLHISWETQTKLYRCQDLKSSLALLLTIQMSLPTALLGHLSFVFINDWGIWIELGMKWWGLDFSLKWSFHLGTLIAFSWFSRNDTYATLEQWIPG